MRIILDNIPTITMPDGLPHIKYHLSFWHRNDVINITAKIRNGNDILKLTQLVDILRNNQQNNLCLDLVYISAGRMDRRIDNSQPATLKLFANMINALEFKVVNLFCPHSDVLEALIDNSYTHIDDNDFYIDAFYFFKSGHSVNVKDDLISIVLPDGGMTKKFFNSCQKLRSHTNHQSNVVECSKKRDMQTGKLSGFKVVNGEPKERCLIIDDLCDGGGTFVGLAEVLKKEHRVKEIGLAVYHGIFSKGVPLANIDWIYTTNSFRTYKELKEWQANGMVIVKKFEED